MSRFHLLCCIWKGEKQTGLSHWGPGRATSQDHVHPQPPWEAPLPPACAPLPACLISLPFLPPADARPLGLQTHPPGASRRQPRVCHQDASCKPRLCSDHPGPWLKGVTFYLTSSFLGGEWVCREVSPRGFLTSCAYSVEFFLLQKWPLKTPTMKPAINNNSYTVSL